MGDNKKYYQKHKERIKAAKRKYYEENKERILAWQKAYREKIRDKLRAYMRERREAKKERLLPIKTSIAQSTIGQAPQQAASQHQSTPGIVSSKSSFCPD